MEVMFVDLKAQYEAIQGEIRDALDGVLMRGDFILGDEVQKFEEEFAAYCETEYAVGLDNGTAALELALRALDIGPGDEVIVPANSFIATAAAVSFVGARPVFVDVNADTYNIDVQNLSKYITFNTKCIIPVHLYGQPADMDPIMTIARRYGLYVIEDACQAHGARYRGRRVGSIGDIAAFSFYPAKNLGAYGDAGAIVTHNADIAERVRMLRNCGQREKYHHVMIAGNHRLDTMQAAVLRVKLRYLDEWNNMRRGCAAQYDDLINGVVTTPFKAPYAEHVYHLYVVLAERRDQLREVLANEGISTGVHYPTPIHLQPAYSGYGYKPGDFPVSEYCAAHCLSLPMFPELKPTQIQSIASFILSYIMGRVIHM